MNSTLLNRRNWIKRTTVATGGVLTAMAAMPVFGKQAFGMTPVAGKSALLENYHVIPSLREPLKARLLANENPWGPSRKAIEAIAQSAAMGNRYVYDSSVKMVEMLAMKEKVPADHILLAPGSTDILEKTAFALCLKGGNVISADPSYLSLVKTATSIGATWKNIPLTPDFAHDLDAMEKAIDSDTKLVYICNPNNPTGTLTPIDKIKAFCRKVNNRVPVFIDEAYLELMDDPESNSAVTMISDGYDVIIARTFSKIHGMAGLRMGYMVAKPERIKSIKELVRTEMGICVTSLSGAMASLKDVEFQSYTRTHNKEGRDYVFDALQKMGMKPIPSHTSFILFPIAMPVKELLSKMFEKGVGIRGYEINGKPYARVSMGTMDELKLFTSSLQSIVS